MKITLREVEDADLPLFFDHWRDPEAAHRAAFLGRDPQDRALFDQHWKKIRADPDNVLRTIVFENQVIGSVSKYVLFGQPEITYGIAREHWGRGLATAALQEFLRQFKTRPLHAHAAKDNVASLRVLEKCGFKITGEERGFALARGEEIDEVALELT
ncbi:MAG TPA: GNAT family N-acetyltransferase [Bryobacteraceae bacterium]|jgi:RimJ/RimL family protein N-acetyltransferase